MKLRSYQSAASDAIFKEWQDNDSTLVVMPMRLVNHSSELIHQIYQRERVDDVAQWRDAVTFPA